MDIQILPKIRSHLSNFFQKISKCRVLLSQEPGLRGLLKMRLRRVCILRLHRFINVGKPCKHGSGRCLDRDMDKHKPRFILTAKEVLEHLNIVESQWAIWVDQRPIIKDIGAVSQQRLLVEPIRQGDHGNRKRGRQNIGVRCLAPNVGLHHKCIMHRRHTRLLIVQL